MTVGRGARFAETPLLGDKKNEESENRSETANDSTYLHVPQPQTLPFIASAVSPLDFKNMSPNFFSSATSCQRIRVRYSHTKARVLCTLCGCNSNLAPSLPAGGTHH